MSPIVNQDGRSAGKAHKAAWDAYITGCVFHSLGRRVLESRNKLDLNPTLDELLHDSSYVTLRERMGRNKIYMHASLYTIDLELEEGPAPGLHDPISSGLSADTTFCVSGITSAVSMRDIFQALGSGNESEEEAVRELRYKIIWLDDASFFVGARTNEELSREDGEATRGLIASHVRNALRSSLGEDVDIAPLGQRDSAGGTGG